MYIQIPKVRQLDIWKQELAAVIMKFPVEQILNLPEMKVLDCQEVEGAGIGRSLTPVRIHRR